MALKNRTEIEVTNKDGFKGSVVTRTPLLDAGDPEEKRPVSYTHLTLPTKA